MSRLKQFRPAAHLLLLAFTLAILCPMVFAQSPFTECPAIGQSASCSVLVVVNADGTVSVKTDTSVGPYDGSDDTLVGVLNNSSQPVTSLQLQGTGIFGFDGDGICSSGISPQPSGCPFGGANSTGYEGPGVTFANYSSGNSGTVQFSPAIPAGGSAYFALEGAPSSVVIQPSPTISTLNPNTVPAGSPAFTMTITGTNFASGEQVQWVSSSSGQTTPLTPTGLTTTQITVQIPANLVAIPDVVTITIVQPSTGSSPAVTSNPVQFTVTPTITAISPSTVAAGGPDFALTITGTSFTSGLQVLWTSAAGETTTLTPTSVTSTQATVTIPAALTASAGSATVAVSLPVAGSSNSVTSNSLTLAIVSLGISAVSPSSIPALSGDTQITISGTGFQPGATVTVTSGQQTVQLTNVNVTSTQITATIPASALSGSLSSVGTDSVKVSEGSVSASANINIAPPANQSVPAISVQLTSQPSSISVQPTLTVTSANPTPASNFVAVLTLSFTPNASNLPSSFSNPAVVFSNGGTSVCFPLPAGPSSTPVTVNLSSVQNGTFSQGTVAGTIQVTPQIYYGSSCTSDNSSVQGSPTAMTPTPTPLTVTVVQAAPVIASGWPKITNVTSTGFDVELNAYSTTRELTTVTVSFTAASAYSLTGQTTFSGLGVSQPAAQWFSSSQSLNTRGKFSLDDSVYIYRQHQCPGFGNRDAI